MFACAGFTEVVDHRLHVFKRPGCIGPQVGPMGLAITGLEHLHWCFIGMQHAVCEDFFFQGIDQRLQLRAAMTLIDAAAGDERKYVKKAVSWALRNIGKRNLTLNAAAIESARRIQSQGLRSARWIAADALRELTSEAVQTRLKKRAHNPCIG